MNNGLRTIPFIAVAALLLGLVNPSLGEAKNEIYTNWRGLAIKGYDAVAFFKDSTPVEGSKEYELTWKEVKWRFASAENRDLFEADPENYAPQYGGYCAWAVAQGSTASVDPKNAWVIVAGKLYLNYNKEIQTKWAKDIPGNIAKADANWPGVLE
ncbi:MAG: YHS domain protein [Desulfofustis sp.]|nr:YHS domain protein [Desulfofustis sp.]